MTNPDEDLMRRALTKMGYHPIAAPRLAYKHTVNATLLVEPRSDDDAVIAACVRWLLEKNPTCYLACEEGGFSYFHRYRGEVPGWAEEAPSLGLALLKAVDAVDA